MIVLDRGAEWRLVTQGDHAAFSARLLALWRADGLPGNPRREELLLATREHDNGWREADAAPRVDRRTGRPYDFLGCPAPLRREIWERGTARLVESRPYAALLITLHGLALHRGRRGEAGWEGFLERLEERRLELLGRAGVGDPEIDADYRLLDLADAISLAVCRGREETIERRGLRFALRSSTIRLDPFPLAGATTFRVACRIIESRRFRGDADFGGALAAARWTSFAVRVAPF